MKRLLVFVFLSNLAFGQISMSQLCKVAKMDMESFEIFAMERGFKLYKIANDNDVQGLSMKRGKSGNEEYLSSYSKYFDNKYSANYQFAKTEILLSTYKELKTLGFELLFSKPIEDNEYDFKFEKSYKRDKETINVFIKSDWVEIGYLMSN